MILHKHLDTNANGHLTIGGVDTVELAKKYGTPVYILDEDVIRQNCRMYHKTLTHHFGATAIPLFASKALCFTEIYRIAAEENLGVDCVSAGELYTARRAGFPMERVYFHGNNKTDADIKTALDFGVGCFVVDNTEELIALNDAAQKRGMIQKILLRITPGVDPHTHQKIITGNVDSKFGTAIATGQAIDIVRHAIELPNVDLAGIHAHIGSQIFDESPFINAAEILLGFVAEIHEKLSYTIRELNLGGGFAVRYTDADEHVDIERNVASIAHSIDRICEERGVTRPKIMFEPGRSLVAAAGITLYTVGSVKEITGFKNYVSIDGGMPDNPRYALYQSRYTALIANRACEPKTYSCTIAGRCCESGDLIAEDIKLQHPQRGDILAVLVTGAYNYSMASNYNRIPRPPVIMVRGGESRVVVKRESFEDIVRLDV